MNSKRFRFAVAALLTLTFLVLSAGWAQAQSIRLKANIPFAFRAGEKLMPAGEYDVRANGVVVKILGPDADQSVMFTTVGISHRIGDDKDAKLIFNKYGDDYVLLEMWWPGEQDGRKALPSTAERELAKNVTPVRIAVALQ